MTPHQTPDDLERFYLITGFEGEQKYKSKDSIKIRYLAPHSNQYDETQIGDNFIKIEEQVGKIPTKKIDKDVSPVCMFV